jgi:alpha-L-rhamnosidase
MQIRDMRVESKRSPLGIDVLRPAFSWGYEASQARSQLQKAYRMIVSADKRSAEQGIGDVWDSGKVISRRSVHVLYEGSELRSRTRYFWKVQAWDQNDLMTESAVDSWEMSLLAESDWSARWIGAPVSPDNELGPLPLFRQEFLLSKPVAGARAYVCGLGQYELRLNGHKVGDHVLEPGWTNYDRTCLYCVYDVTEAMREGANAVGVLLGNGFYNVTGGRYKKFTGSFGTLSCLVQLEITHTDGTIVTVVSDQDWRTADGPVRFSCIYGGEDFDARCEEPGWDQPRFHESAAWKQAVETAPPKGSLKAQAISPLKVMRTFQPQRISQPAPGVYVVDFGQNFSGWVELSVVGPEGARITLSPAELLKEDGKVNQKWTGSPYRFHYILRGTGEAEEWSPRFSYYGFRYVQIEGAVFSGMAEPGHEQPVLVNIEGHMIYPDTEVTGSFQCSDALLNRTHEIINWAILSNMKSYFTDCPHREKLGWLEQTYLMGPSVAYNYNIEPLLTKTMEDIRDAQLPNGMVPTTAPEYVQFAEEWRCFRDSVSWGAAYVLVGWNLLSQYGNSRILEEHYDGMKAYVDYVSGCADHDIVSIGLGDWYDDGPKGPGFAQNTTVAHTETAMYYHMVDMFVSIAQLLGREQDAERYAALRDRIRDSFNRRFFDTVSSLYDQGSQAAQAMPLALGLTDEPYQEKVLAHLLEDIRRRSYHTTAGDVGYRYVLQALARSGRSDVILAMASRTDHPSYGYQIAHGATTLTEAWDGPTVGKSQNHFMLGHIEEWFYSGLGGITYRFDPLIETYQLQIQPAYLDGLHEVIAEHLLPVGRVRMEWRREQSSPNVITLRLDIPVNCTAEVRLPVSLAEQITENGVVLEKADGIQSIRLEASGVEVILASGSYHFQCVEAASTTVIKQTATAD